MTHLEQSAATRTLTIVLPEEDWRALRAAEPDAIGWLQERIRERLAGSPAAERGGYSAPSTPGSDSWWGTDEY
jgi:hypothetical protein